MQFRRVLGLTLLYVGLIILLFGLLSVGLPRLQNEQVQLILASFEIPSQNPVLGFVNQLFLNMIHYAYQLLLVGAALVLGGSSSLLLSRARGVAPRQRKDRTQNARDAGLPASVPNSSPVNWRRPSPIPVAESGSSLGSTLALKGFAPLLDSPQPEPPLTIMSRPIGSNPYLAYGTSAYTPPSKAAPSMTAEDLSLPVQDQSLPDSLWPDESSEDHQSASQPEPLQHSYSEKEPLESEPLAFHKPAFAFAIPLSAGDADIGSRPPRIRSTMAAPKAISFAHLSAASGFPSSAPSSGSSTPKPHYLSDRIRCTVKCEKTKSV